MAHFSGRNAANAPTAAKGCSLQPSLLLQSLAAGFRLPASAAALPVGWMHLPNAANGPLTMEELTTKRKTFTHSEATSARLIQRPLRRPRSCWQLRDSSRISLPLPLPLALSRFLSNHFPLGSTSRPSCLRASEQDSPAMLPGRTRTLRLASPSLPLSSPRARSSWLALL